ncbi:hypothetical protein AYI69_g3607 [Smittium culicis]|uniref:Uncharacterized protein n=1 Tax=Smittium culicis TaxID=133412 RepID=A0A1R1YJJ6_9FUNG|nr:hypothetical protein AYI69_g3607 [Smittium culicis]
MGPLPIFNTRPHVTYVSAVMNPVDAPIGTSTTAAPPNKPEIPGSPQGTQRTHEVKFNSHDMEDSDVVPEPTGNFSRLVISRSDNDSDNRP